MKCLIIALVLAILATATTQAGTSGVLNGYARTERGQPIVGAQVKVVSASRIVMIRTDARGFFVFADLPPDVYVVALEKSGYRNVAYAGMRVNSDQTTFLAFTMNRPQSCGSVPLLQSADQRDEVFTSLDLRALSDYPPSLRFLMISVPGPGPSTRNHVSCL